LIFLSFQLFQSPEAAAYSSSNSLERRTLQ
jgi:hypothetical protein